MTRRREGEKTERVKLTDVISGVQVVDSSFSVDLEGVLAEEERRKRERRKEGVSSSSTFGSPPRFNPATSRPPRPTKPSEKLLES